MKPQALFEAMAAGRKNAFITFSLKKMLFFILPVQNLVDFI